MRHALAALLILCASGPVAHADEELGRAAQLVLEAVRSGNEKALAALASTGQPDPWLIADHLASLGAADAAQRFAASTKSLEVERLAAYLERAQSRAYLSSLRKHVAAATRSLSGGDAQAVLDQLGGVKLKGEAVPMVQVHLLRGKALDVLQENQRAAACHLEAADMAERLGWWAGASHALYFSARAQDRAGKLGEARDLYERHLTLEQRLQSEIGRGRAHFRLANVLLAMQSPEERAKAAHHLEQAHMLTEASGDHEYLASVLSTEARSLARRDREAALTVARQAAEEIRKTDPEGLASRFRPDPLRLAESEAVIHMVCASLATNLGDREAAATHVASAVKAAKKGGDKRLLSRTRAVLGVIEGETLIAAGRNIDALETFRKARDEYETGGSIYHRADIRRRIAATLATLGDLPKAYTRLEEVFKLLKTVTWAKDLLCKTHIHAGSICTRLSRGEEALVHLRTALHLATALKSDVHRADALAGLARCHAARAELAEAVTMARQGLEPLNAESQRGARGRLRLILGKLYRRMGDLEGAESLIKSAVEDLGAAGEAWSLWVASNEHASLLQVWGETDEARTVWLKSLDEQQRLESPRGLAWAHMGLAQLEREAGRHAVAAKHRGAALARFGALRDQRAEAFARVQFGVDLFWAGQQKQGLEKLLEAKKAADDLDDAWTLAYCAMGLAHAYSLMGSDAKCMRWAAKGIEITAGLGMDLAEGEGALAREGFSSLPSLGAQSALKLGEKEALYRFLEQGRAATLLAALGGRSAMREATVSDELRADEERNQAKVAMAFARYSREKQDRRPNRLPILRERHKELNDAREALADSFRAIRRAVRMHADLAYPAPVPLGKISAALSDDEALIQYAVLGTEVIALVIRSKGATPCSLGGSAEVTAAVARLWSSEDHKVNAAAAGPLRRLLIDGLKLGPGIKRLLISTGPELAYVPFSMLLPEKQTVLVPSATSFHVLRSLDTAPGTSVLALGDPEYGGRLPQLRLSKEEVDAIATRKGDVKLTGAKATKKAFLAHAASATRWRAVHLACHGMAERDTPMMSKLELAGDDEDEGSLWALDVFRMHLPADLVVLSACETGVGRVVTGEGILGLTRAFLQVGASSVIASLWEVDDHATSALMKRFYQLWRPPSGKPGVSVAEALQRAQAHVRDQKIWKHPKYWAAWVLWGLPD